MTMRRLCSVPCRLGVGLALLLIMRVCEAQLVLPPTLPLPVRLYEAHKAQLAGSGFTLNLCRLLAHPEPEFFATPADERPLECDLAQTLLAYDDWCRAGIEARVPHRSRPYHPRIRIETVAGWRIVYVNHVLKTGALPTQADLDAATAALDVPPGTAQLPVYQPATLDLWLGHPEVMPLTPPRE